MGHGRSPPSWPPGRAPPRRTPRHRRRHRCSAGAPAGPRRPRPPRHPPPRWARREPPSTPPHPARPGPRPRRAGEAPARARGRAEAGSGPQRPPVLTRGGEGRPTRGLAAGRGGVRERLPDPGPAARTGAHRNARPFPGSRHPPQVPWAPIPPPVLTPPRPLRTKGTSVASSGVSPWPRRFTL